MQCRGSPFGREAKLETPRVSEFEGGTHHAFIRVELFARQSPPGWDVWGNEVEPTIPDFWTKCPEAADQKEGL